MSLCLACGAANPLDTKFCTKCGKRLLIQDRYRALRVIGRGSFGMTFLAQDEGKPRKPKCAIKQFLYDDPETLQDAKRLFEQEAIRLDDLGKHPQIPELLAHAEQDGIQYLVQEFIDGEDLKKELKRLGAFSETKIEELLLDLLPVLQFIHTGKVIHRDIKPENIIRRQVDQKLVLVDFGAAKVASQTALQKTGTTIGSAGYAAPEQAFGKVLFSSDVYSLGVTCLNLLTNVNPLEMYDPMEGFAWQKFLQDRKISNTLSKILDKMTQSNVKNRYQSVDNVLKDLQKPTSSRNRSVANVAKVIQPLPISAETPINLTLDCGNGLKLELVKVMAGSFNMGSDEYDDEKPVHRVSLREFFIGKYPVTQAQYQAVMGENPSNFKDAQNPVETVTWHDAMEFCQKLSQKTGQKVRLPTESEWEYAAKGGNQSKGYKYAGSDNLDEVGWYGYYDNSGGKTHPVGQKKANELGIYDMSGNVWEWCEDVRHENYNGAPTDGTAWLVGGEQEGPIFRGGSWGDCVNHCRSANRFWGDTVERQWFLGFRVVL